MIRNDIGGNYQLPRRQSGAVLIIAMVVLLVMSVVAISSKVNTVLQQKMATSTQQRTLANLAAEAGLRAGEAYLTAQVKATSALSRFGGGTTGLYANYRLLGTINDLSPASDALVNPVKSSQWLSGNSVEVADYHSDMAFSPRYIIEYVGRDKGSANKVVVDPNDPNFSADQNPHVFQITAIGWSKTASIYSVLQTTYRTGAGANHFIY